MQEARRHLVDSGQASQRIDFESLYDQYATDVLRVCYYYLGDRHKAEDICQEVFVRLLTHTPDFSNGNEKAWLLKVALNLCRDHWRGAWVKRVVLNHPAFELIPAEDEYANVVQHHDVMKAINGLSPPFKEVILLYFYQGYSIAEIAEMLQLPEGTVASRMYRAKEKLENFLQGDELK